MMHMMEMGLEPSFEWNEKSNQANQRKHGVSFEEAQLAFFDSKRIVAQDLIHSGKEQRFYCFGKVADMVVTVRFMWRENKIRIFGAGYWRQGRSTYEKENDI